MPGIHIDLTDEEYASIPGKKRTWCREVLKEALRAIVDYEEMPAKEDSEPTEGVYSFRIKGKVHSGPGTSAADAAKRLGLVIDPTIEWTEGTFENNLLDV